MKKMFLSLLVAAGLSSSAQNITFQKEYPFSFNSCFSGIDVSSDNSYLVAGYSILFGNDIGTLIKIDRQGNLIFSKTYKVDLSNTQTEFVDIVKTVDGGCVLLGNVIKNIGSTPTSGLIVKTDSSGNIIWARIFENRDIWFTAIDQSYDGGFIISGSIDYNSYSFLVKINSNGDVEWSKSFMPPEAFYDYCYGTKVAQLSNGSYIIMGFYGGQGINESYFFINCNANGDTLWTKISADTSAFAWTHGIEPSNDGGFLYTGGYNGDASKGLMIVKADQNGNIEWAKQYGDTCEVGYNSIERTYDGNYFIMSQLSQSIYNGFQLLRIDDFGNVINSTLYSDTSNFLPVIKITSDNGIVMTGARRNSFLGRIPLVIKADANGKTIDCDTMEVSLSVTPISNLMFKSGMVILSGCSATSCSVSSADSAVITAAICFNIGIPETNSKSLIKLFPNPTADKFTIDFGNSLTDNTVVKISNALGQLMKEIYIPSGNNSVEIDVSKFRQGLYFCNIYEAGKLPVNKKFVVSK